MDNETSVQLSALREEVRAMAAQLAEQGREFAQLKASVVAQFAGENDPIEINRKIRNLALIATGSSDAGGEGGTVAGGGGGGGGGTPSLAEQITTIVSVLCAGGTVTAECREDGTGMDGTVTFEGLTCP